MVDVPCSFEKERMLRLPAASQLPMTYDQGRGVSCVT